MVKYKWNDFFGDKICGEKIVDEQIFGVKIVDETNIW